MGSIQNNKRALLLGLVLVLVLVLLAAVLAVSRCAKDAKPETGEYPFSIAITFGDDPATQKNFSWLTELKNEGSVVEYYIDDGSTPDFTRKDVQHAEGFSQRFDTFIPKEGSENKAGAALDPVTYMRHGVYISGLEPNTKYVYRVGDGKYFSEAATFITAPQETLSGGNSFSFLIVEDTQGFIQNDFALWGGVFKKALEEYPDVSFMAHIGDFTERQENALSWRQYFGLAPGLGNITTVPVEGNKDDETFLTYFLLGTQGGVTGLNGYYSFDYMGVHFSVVNTRDGDKDLSKAQLKWLRNDLASDNAQSAFYRLVLIHKAPYSDRNHADDSEIVAIRGQLLPVFEEYGVDVVIEGHDHFYFRSEPVYQNGSRAAEYSLKTVTVNDDEVALYCPASGNSSLGGVFYFMPGASGVKQHDGNFREMPEIIAARSELMTSPTFCICSITEERIIFVTKAFNRYSGKLTTVECWGIERTEN